jgi:FG-GAP-like repeat
MDSSALVLCGVLGLTTAIGAQTVLRTFSVPGSWLVGVGDLDGDGLTDLVASDSTGLRLYSTGSGALIGTYAYASSSYGPDFRVLGDVNGDGRDDLAVLTTASGAVVAQILASPTGAVLFTLPIPYAYEGYFVGLDDLNGDGRAEFAIGDPFAAVGGVADLGRLDIHDGATATIWRTHVGTVPAALFGKVYPLGDLDGDGVRDYSLGGWSTIPIAHSGATGTALYALHAYASSGVWSVGDLDADGCDEWKVVAPYGHGAQSAGDAIFSGATGQWMQGFTYWFGGTGMAGAGPLGDLDADGHDDLVLWADLGAGAHSRMLSGRNWSVIGTHTPASIGGSPGDVDGDGCRDLWSSVQNHSRQVISGVRPGVSMIGSGCPDSTGVVPRIGVGLGAKLGGTMTVNLSDANPGLGGALLVLGHGNTAWGGVPLPLDLGVIGMPGCIWHVEGATQLLVTTVGSSAGRRRASYTIVVPASPQLVGLAAFGQWLVLDPPGAGSFGAVTRAVRFQVVP